MHITANKDLLKKEFGCVQFKGKDTELIQLWANSLLPRNSDIVFTTLDSSSNLSNTSNTQADLLQGKYLLQKKER